MALYKETHKIKVFEPNSITLNAVQGEGNEREYEFILIENQGTLLKPPMHRLLTRCWM